MSRRPDGGEAQAGPDADAPARRILWGLGAANVVAWIWAAAAFGGAPRLLGMAGLAWLFGLRHAMDSQRFSTIAVLRIWLELTAYVCPS